MKFIAGLTIGSIVTAMITVGPYNVASSVASFIEFVQGLGS